MNGSYVVRVVLVAVAALCALVVLFGVPVDVDAVKVLAFAVLLLAVAVLV